MVWLSTLTAGLPTKGSLVLQFPVRAHAWVAGQVPSRGRVRGNQSHWRFSPSLPFSKNKYILKTYWFLIILLHFTIIYVIEVISINIISVWWNCYIIMYFCPSLPTSAQWRCVGNLKTAEEEVLLHENGQILQIRDFSLSKSVINHLPVF